MSVESEGGGSKYYGHNILAAQDPFSMLLSSKVWRSLMKFDVLVVHRPLSSYHMLCLCKRIDVG